MRGTAYVCLALLALLLTPALARGADDTGAADIEALVEAGALPASALAALSEDDEDLDALLPLLLASGSEEGLNPLLLMMMAKEGGGDLEELIPFLMGGQGKVGQLPLLWLAHKAGSDMDDLIPFLLLGDDDIDPAMLMLLAGEGAMGPEEMALLQSLGQRGPRPGGPPATAIVHGENLLVIEGGTVYKIDIADMEVVDSVRYVETPGPGANPLADLMRLGMLFRKETPQPPDPPDVWVGEAPRTQPAGEETVTVEQAARFLESMDDEAIEETLDGIAEEQGAGDLDDLQSVPHDVIRSLFDAAAASEDLSVLVQAHGFADAAEWVWVAKRVLPAMGPALQAMITGMVGEAGSGAEVNVSAGDDELAVFTDVFGAPTPEDVATVTEALKEAMGAEMEGALSVLSEMAEPPDPPEPDEPEGAHVAW